MICDTTKCESPIESRFIESVSPLIDPEVKVWLQKGFVVGSQSSRVDFFLEHDGRGMIVECDGREYHEYWRDCRRDLAILSAGLVDDVVRFRGTDIHNHIDSCVATLRAFCPWVFDKAAQRPTLPYRIACSRIFGPHGCKPIIRSSLPVGQVLEADIEAQTWVPRGFSRDATRVLAEFKSPYWNWNPGLIHGSGGNAASLSDAIEEVYAEAMVAADNMDLRRLKERL